MAASASKSGTLPKPNLEQYVFSEKLGSGTYATVYKAYRKTGIREVVAIKCVLKSSLNKASTDNLLTEIELLKNLKHEHIVTLKDFYWDSNYIYLIMEYCSGGDLSRFIRSKRALPENVVKKFLQQIASAMKFLWDNSIAHMDLKPQNILLSSPTNPQIKLADFGFAKPLYDGDCLHVMRGSPLYMAPEIIREKQYDNRVDLWSIGVILFECLFGKAPFASKSYKELGEKIWDDKPVEIPFGVNISDTARDLLLGLLKRDPGERMTFEEFFAHPMVDIEHWPSSHSLPTAIEIVSKAVDEDKKGKVKSAIQLYFEALLFFMPAIHYEKDHRKKNALREKVKGYMDRAEVLKQQLKPQAPSTNPSHDTSEKPLAVLTTSNSSSHNNNGKHTSPLKTSVTPPSSSPTSSTKPTLYHRNSTESRMEELWTLCLDSPELTAALQTIKCALIQERIENYQQCLQDYKSGLEVLFKLVPDEPKGRRKDLLNSQISKWMDQAESISSYLEVQHLITTKESLEDDQELSKKSTTLHHVIHIIYVFIFSYLAKIYALLYRIIFG